MVVWQHHGGAAGQVREFLPVHLGAHGINLGGACLGGGVHPHVKADIVGFHRVVGDTLFAHGGFPCFHKLRVHIRVGGLEVVPCREVAHEVGGVQTGQLFFTHGEGHNRNVIRRDASRRQLFVKPNVGVAVDGGDHTHFFAVRAQRHNIGHDLGPVGMTKRGVVYKDILIGNAFALQIAFQNVVGGTRVHIVGAQQREFLNTQFVEEVIGGRDRLLVWRRTGVEHVFGAFFALILHRIEQQAVELFDHWQHGFAGHGCPVAKDHIHIMHGQQLARFFCKQRPVRGRIHNHRFELFAQQATFGVLLVDQHQHGVFQCGFRDGHGAGQRVQHAHFDGVFRRHRSPCERSKNQRSGERGFQKGHKILPAGRAWKRLRQSAGFLYLIPQLLLHPCGGFTEVQIEGRHTPTAFP